MKKFCMGCMEQYDEEFEVCPFCGYVDGTVDEDSLHIMPGEILHDRYIVGKAIGFGGFGVTYIGWDALLEHKIAIKEYMPSEFSTRALGTKEVTIFGGKKSEQFNSGLRKFHEEARKLAKFSNDDGIVRVYDTFEENNTAYIIMELLEGETLASYFEHDNKIPYDRAINIILPIANALREVHTAGVIHRDIAPDNIFLTNDGKVKLIDFGAARFATTSHSRSLSVLIKPGYSPEEQYRSRGDQGPYTDVYALGAVLYRLITGETPPDALERRAFFENKKKDILIPIDKFTRDIPENTQNAIYNAMNVRIEDRTQSTNDFIEELTTDQPVKRRKGKIKAIDFLRWPLWAKITFPSLAVLVITLSVLFATGVIGFKNFIKEEIYVPDGMSRVPSIVSSDMESAEGRLEKAVLLYSISGKEYSSLIPADLILSQSIDGGAVVIQNTVIDLVISGGAETAVVPNIIGMYEDEAITKLSELGFLYKTEYEFSSSVAEGGVIAQSVDPDSEYPIGNEVVLTISKGRDPDQEYDEILVEVPDFTGLTYDEAMTLASEHQLLIVAKEKVYSSEFNKDIIMRQNVEAGSQILSGNTIELTVSLGIHIIKVPDVVYKTEQEAIKLLQDNELTSSVTYVNSETVKAGLVISQSPNSGTEASTGDKVSLVVSKGGTAFSMPDVVGMDENSAKSLLLSKGLSVTVDYEYSSASDIGNVLRQSVTANSDVNIGTSVHLTVSSGEELVNVANVVGLTQKDATNTLKNQGFTVKANEVYNETVESGKVISQSPDAGTSQTKGTVILLTVSKGKAPIEVPSVVGIAQPNAESTLKSLRFTVSITSGYSETVSSGAVISQKPSAGSTAYSGDTITLVISKGREPISIPNVIGTSKSSATTKLETLGFIVSSTEEYSDSVVLGNVISQSPESGMGFKNDVVRIVVSKGKAPVPPSKVTLDKTSLTLFESGNNTAAQLSATVSPNDANDKTLTWSSSNTNVATVTSNGFVQAVGTGSATITVKTNTAGKTATCKVTVKPKQVSSITVASKPTKIQYDVGESLDTSGLKLTVNYNTSESETVTSGFSCNPMSFNEIGEKNVTVTYNGKSAGSFTVDVVQPTEYYSYDIDVGESISVGFISGFDSYINVSSSNSNVATATKSSITGIGAGKADITYKIVMNGKTYATNVITVNVKKNIVLVTSFSINRTNTTNDRIDMTVGSTYQLNPTVYPENATNKTINWTSSNTDVATVDSNGVIHAHYAGWSTLTGTAADGSGVTKTTKISVDFLSEVVSPGTTINMKVGESVYVTWIVRGMEHDTDFQPITNSTRLSNGNSNAVEWDRSDFKREQVSYDGKYYTYYLTFKFDAKEKGSTKEGCYSQNSTCEWVTINVS